MAPETLKALLMMALILAIEVTVNFPRIQSLWHRRLKMAPRIVSAKRKIR